MSMYCRFCKKVYIALTVLFLLLSCFVFTSCGVDDTKFLSLDDSWLYSLDESNPSVWQPISFSGLQNLTKLFPGTEGYVWLKNSFTVPDDLKNEAISVYLGKVRVAAEVWLNDEYIGMAGRMPPDKYIPGNKAWCFSLPEQLLNKDGTNTLKISIYVNGSGGILTNTFIGPEIQIEQEALTYTYRNSSIALGAACILVMVGIGYLAIWSIRRKTKSYLYYALMNLASACYLSQFYVSELPFLVNMSYLTFSKLVPAISAFVTGYFATSFIRSYFDDKDSDNIFIIRVSLLFVPSLIALCITDVATFTQALPFLYIFLVAQICFAVVTIVKAFLKRSKDVIRLLIGFSPVLAGILVDIIVHVILKMSELPFFTVFGWQGVILAFLFDLTLRLKGVYSRLELLNAQLEQQVYDRTKNLSDVNILLEKEQKRSNADLAMAEKVQKSFLIPEKTDFEEWDIAIFYQPLSGVSGDLYDVFSENGEFQGAGLFDVSGHGMAAGLVTMLAKNIIANQFHSGMKPVKGTSKLPDLTQIMYSVNNALIEAKGDIENYLTGAIFRVIDDNGSCEVVNAGNPFPLLNHDGQITELKPIGKTQMGMIGIDGLDVSFPTVSFALEPGDSFLIFTDGLTEAENRFGEQFGVARLSREFADCTGLTAQEQLDYILHCHKSFTGDFPHEDDISAIIIHRNKKAAD